MNQNPDSVLRDGDLLELLHQEPELFAIADALASTQATQTNWLLSRGRFAPVAAVAAAVIAAIALLLIAPWQSGLGPVAEALAAVGSADVLHVTISTTTPPDGSPLVDLRSGAIVPQQYVTNVWFDHSRGLEATTIEVDGKQISATLQTNSGGWTENGPIYTCPWIVAHPVEAARARVSCDSAAGATSALPLDPALRGFLDGYQQALSTGTAIVSGRDQINGRSVVWLTFPTTGAKSTEEERVAVDAGTYVPVQIQLSRDGARIVDSISDIATIPYNPELFAKPEQIKVKSSQTSVSSTAETLADVEGILGTRGYWLGPAVDGLTLQSVKHVTWQVDQSGETVPQTVDGVELDYGTSSRSTVRVYEATSCLAGFGWTCGPSDPSATGTLRDKSLIALARVDKLAISVVAWPNGLSLTAAELAKALIPIDQ